MSADGRWVASMAMMPGARPRATMSRLSALRRITQFQGQRITLQQHREILVARDRAQPDRLEPFGRRRDVVRLEHDMADRDRRTTIS